MLKIIKEISIALVFMLILILPLAFSIFDFIPSEKVKEQRALKSLPEFNLGYLDPFPQQFESYYSDNFELRNHYLILNSWLKLDLLNVAPISKKAIIGENGWMYLRKDINEVYLGKNLVDIDKLKNYYEIFKYRKNFLDSINCKYYFVIAPVKVTIYPEFLPLSKYIPRQFSLTDQIVSLLDTVQDFTIIDLRPVLKNAKSDIRLFNKTDTHWNDYGSLLAYESIMNIISKDFPNLSPHDLSEYSIDSVLTDGMNMLHMLGIYHEIRENRVFQENRLLCTPASFKNKSKKGKKNGYTIPEWFSLKAEYELVFTNEDDSLPKLLMIRDSFARTVIPYLSEHFSESVYIFDGWHHDFNENIVIEKKPDIFIQFVLESQIPYLYNNSKKPKK